MIRRADECKAEYREHMRDGDGTVMLTSPVLLKALDPIDVTVLGIVISSSAGVREKALDATASVLAGIV